MFTNKRYVYEVFKAKSFSKAAERLYISQPSLSLTIKKIEERLGAQLFDRSTTPLRLTDCGKEYIKCIQKVMDIEDGFATYLSNYNDLRTGSLSIGASNFFASYILPPMIARFKSQYPRIAVDLIETNTVRLEKQLCSGELDLAIENSAFNKALYKQQFFYREQMIFAAPEKFPHNKYAKKFRLSAEDIIGDKHHDPKWPAVPLHYFEDAPFILLRIGNDTRERADKIFAENKIVPNIVLELDQMATTYHVACHGIGAILISDTLVRKTAPDPRMVYYKVDSSCGLRENYFYFKAGKYLTRAMQEFIKLAPANGVFS